MSDVGRTIHEIEAAAERLGLPELGRLADVPYSTLIDMRAKGWRPKSVLAFERLAAVAADKARAA